MAISLTRAVPRCVVQNKEKIGNGGVFFKPEFAMLRLLTDFWSSESGTTAIEYGLIAVGISVTIIAAVNSVGNSLKADLARINP
jgi:pilus assembly protein Flp/PilA